MADTPLESAVRESLRDEREDVGRGPTGARKEVLAWQAALRLLRGESPNAVESSLLARGVYPADEIMELAYEYALSKTAVDLT